MRIAFITDLHVGTETQQPLGVDVRQNLRDVLAFLPQIKPDYLIIGGDVCYETGDPEIYRWVRSQLDAQPLPYALIAGNHDNSVQLAEAFGLEQDLHDDELYFSRLLNQKPVWFLDTAKASCSPAQWAWLREQLRTVQEPVILFMHHPPLPAGVGHMDLNYPFRQSAEMLDLLHSLPVPVTVVCGHYHVEKVVLSGNLTVLITPSLFFQMKHDPEEVVIDHYRPAVREINWTPHTLTSTIHWTADYADGAD